MAEKGRGGRNPGRIPTDDDAAAACSMALQTLVRLSLLGLAYPQGPRAYARMCFIAESGGHGFSCVLGPSIVSNPIRKALTVWRACFRGDGCLKPEDENLKKGHPIWDGLFCVVIVWNLSQA